MRVVLLAQMDQMMGIHYAIALHRRGHQVTAIHVEEPDGSSDAIAELRDIELLTPYRGGRKHERDLYRAWAAADKARARAPPLALAAARMFSRIDRAALEEVADLVASRQPDLVLGMWGLNAYPEFDTLLRRFPRGERDFVLAYDWNTYPIGDEAPGTAGVNPIDRRIAEGIDLRIHASPRKQMLMEEHMDLRGKGADIVFPDGFTELATPRERLPLASEAADGDGAPHLLYHGTWEVKTGSQDDTGALLREVMEAGVHLHFPAKRGRMPQHAMLHPYEPLSMQAHVRGEVFRLATQCDACLVEYHLPVRRAKFETFLPTRFLSGVASGLPIALPKGKFPPCEDFVALHGNGFTFTDAADLKAQLDDRERMAALRKRAVALGEGFGLEARLPVLEKAVAEITR